MKITRSLLPILAAFCLAVSLAAADKTSDADFTSIFDGTLKTWQGEPTYWRMDSRFGIVSESNPALL